MTMSWWVNWTTPENFSHHYEKVEQTGQLHSSEVVLLPNQAVAFKLPIRNGLHHMQTVEPGNRLWKGLLRTKKHSGVILSISKHRHNLAQRQPVCHSQSAGPEFQGIQIFNSYRKGWKGNFWLLATFFMQIKKVSISTPKIKYSSKNADQKERTRSN